MTDIEIYDPPGCTVCGDRAYRQLPNYEKVCKSCEYDVLVVHAWTGQDYLSCIEALKQMGQNQEKAIQLLRKRP